MKQLILLFAFRAGRLFPGTVIRFYSQKMFKQLLQEYDIPEILRISLSSTLLHLKGTFTIFEFHYYYKVIIIRNACCTIIAASLKLI